MKSNLKKLRMNSGMSQKQLAEKAGIVPSQILKMELEGANPTLKSAFKVAKAIGADIGQIWVS